LEVSSKKIAKKKKKSGQKKQKRGLALNA
jgi:hypothetical protein